MDTPFCPPSNTPPLTEQQVGDTGAQVQPEVELTGADSLLGSTLPHQFGTADAVNVLMLAQKLDAGRIVKTLDIYSGLNGHHIRTIPGERFHNPVLVAGGEGYVVVVDRFGDRDLIRVTDVYAGAGSQSFDTDGFPSSEVDWRNTADLMSFAVGQGKTVTGISVSMHGELLVGLAGATVDNDPVTALFYADLPALEAVGMTTNTDLMAATFPKTGRLSSQPYTRTRLLLLPASMRYLGEPMGAPCFGSARIGDTHRWAITSVWDTAEQAGAVLVYDTIYRRLVGALGLPDGYQPMSTAHSGQIVSVGLQSVSDAYDQIVVRLLLSEESPFFTGTWKNALPLAGDYSVGATFAVQDSATVPTTKAELLRYLRLSSAINFSPETSRGDRTSLVAQVDQLPDDWRSTTDYATQEEANLERVASNATYESSFYATVGGSPSIGIVTIPAQVIGLEQPLDETKTRRIVAGNSTLNTVAEALAATAEDQVDTTMPLFLLLHNTHYDWITSGGFTYGCRIGGGLDSSITNGTTPYAIGVMRAVEAGSLKDLPDLRVALVDELTGRFLYRDAKPRGVRMYAGTYASLSDPSGILVTPCSATIDAIATEKDGIPRPGKGLLLPYPPAFTSSMLDLDRPFELVRRRVAPTGTISAKLAQRGWSMQDDEGLNPVWALPSAGRAFRGMHSINYPTGVGERDYTLWTLSNSAGFFFLDLPKIRSTQGRKLLEEIADAQNELQQVQNTLAEAREKLIDLEDALAETPPAQQPSLQRLIQSQEAAIAALESQAARLGAYIVGRQDRYNAMSEFDREEVTYTVPLSLRKRTYKPLDLSPTQDVEESEELNPDAAGGSDGSVVRISDRAVACVVRSGIRTWIGVEVILDRWEQLDDGVSYWAHPELRENGLGIPVGNYVTGISEAFLLTGSKVYESGYLAAGGALGTWEVDIYADGAKINNSQYRIFDPESLLDLAPSDAVGELYGTILAGKSNIKWERYHKGKVYGFPYDVQTVEVRAKLVNTGIYVYRNGFRTLRRINGGNFISQQIGGPYTCWQTDPGFYGDTICESLGCGNVSCKSFLFHKNKLYSSDPIYKWTRQVLWEGSAIFNMQPDPYQSAGIAVGKVMNCFWKMDFNANMNRYYVDLRDGKGPIVA